jgi:hypothetical protein
MTCFQTDNAGDFADGITAKTPRRYISKMKRNMRLLQEHFGDKKVFDELIKCR